VKNESAGQPVSYVEVRIHSGVDRIWQLTQDPHLHQRWDLRFDRITYLPRTGSGEPQCFLYETRVGFGLSTKGTGESIGQFSPKESFLTPAADESSQKPICFRKLRTEPPRGDSIETFRPSVPLL
jgi:hypothetical protein